jgi:hypothetical protein
VHPPGEEQAVQQHDGSRSAAELGVRHPLREVRECPHGGEG